MTMAIKIDLSTSQFGVPFMGAYFRIVTANVARQRDPLMRNSVTIDIVGYAAKPLDEDTREVEFRRFNAAYQDVESMVGSNFLSKCYAWVMAQANMSGAVSV